MKISKFEVIGLFDLYNHILDFGIGSDNASSDDKASVIMLFGRNGIGKTTILRMIDGLMTLDFDTFRISKFRKACLSFSNGQKISVEPVFDEKKENLVHLLVKYKSLVVHLHPKTKGALTPKEKDNELNFVKSYNADLDKFSFEFIDTERLIRKNIKDEMLVEEAVLKGKIIRKQKTEPNKFLVEKVKSFVRDSQVNFSNYFYRTEPELFDRIISNLESKHKLIGKDLLDRVNNLSASEKEFSIERLGLAREKWDKKKLIKIIKESKADQNKLTIIASYLEVLESRNNERLSLAERLLTFETLLNEFLLDKKIIIENEEFRINSTNKKQDLLNESQLSTGEYHLLYLTVLALCTKVKGTVIAIDEPEMSMHIGWQRKLVNTLINISSKASPQMIFATHSPDIAANFINSLTTEDYAGND
jgi:ABC-type cobalamin/Fe3+-siderophores transport system ATPase subunit